MSKKINTPFTVLAPFPIDTRTQVSSVSGLNQIPVVYIGLKCYVVDEDIEYRYKATGWVPINTQGTSTSVWGSITGSLSDQTDLNSILNQKFNTSGGTITGDVIGQGTFEGINFILTGSTGSNPGEPGYIPYSGAVSDIDINNKIITSTTTIAQLKAASSGVLITREFLQNTLKTENLQKLVFDTPYTLSEDDFNYVLFIMNGETNFTVNVPLSLPDNFCCGLIQKGESDVNFQAGLGVILVNPTGYKIRGKNHAVFIEKNLNTAEVNLLGDTKL
jgi:hypothetical protein